MKRSRIKVDEFPCKKLGYCPYGNLVEKFPVDEVGGGEKNCPRCIKGFLLWDGLMNEAVCLNWGHRCYQLKDKRPKGGIR